ncbi:RNA methyltransferase [Dongia sp.]|uniref:RNA methyltransferase n=1 Tax=Dongia sp. TaxID=1977262 RepID=UPI003752C2D3
MTAPTSERGIPPAVILVEPQLAENIGTAARAMLNCGLTDLRLVNPRDPFPSERALAASVGALEIMPPVRIFDSTQAAVADLQMVYATTARERKMVKPILTPRAVGEKSVEAGRAGRKVGVLFGKERTGLEKDDVALADAVVTVPLNPDFTSLNLAQAVLLIGYEWYQAGDSTPARVLETHGAEPATKEELYGFFAHFEKALDECGFLRNEEARPNMIRNLRNMWGRAELTEQEIRTLHGVVKELTTLREKKRP